ncbi:MAGa7180 family putative nuclease [Candidatus Mycoplasma mahonii]|uniref:MAGa7180 family putative nuclease n=1 Tax=Candidatus Mycoplasma mahonii TaxID=3004105 RepID=UPI0026F29EA8|nr:hypothetical protein [Candidatus Mycoplasma mahonii]WKX02397.1 hypothetical protein O3I44_03320 [Candidatus Mycoplasma mahonii]
MSIKRHFYNEQHYTIDPETKKITLKNNFHGQLLNKGLWGGSLGLGFKKIGGSSVGDVLLVDNYKSRFQAFCRMSWVGVPILDRKYVDAGIAIEPKVLDLISNKLSKPVKGFPAKEYNYDYFKGKDDVVGGLPDGLLEADGIVIEVKTTGAKNFDKWKKWGIPVAYHKQSQLYTYLMGLKEYVIVATFLEEEDYAHPEDYDIVQRKTKLWKFKIDNNQVEDDIKKIKTWYYEYTKSGISPEWDPILDKEQIEYLQCKNVDEWLELQNKWIQQGKIPHE